MGVLLKEKSAKNAGGTVGLYDTVGGSFLAKSNGNAAGSLSDMLIDKTFDDDFTLLGDEVFGTITVAAGKTLDLNGHNLTMGGLAGDGTITAGLQDLFLRQHDSLQPLPHHVRGAAVGPQQLS